MRARHREIEDRHMADIINLRRARREKARLEREREADANRLRFGRTKVKKITDQDDAARRQRSLDDKRLTPKPDDEDT
jgi:hypothetical protein